MYITNIWGIFFCFYLPVLITIYIAYEVGYEEAKRKYHNKKRRRKVGDYKNGRRDRTRGFNK